jgi:predicted transcriptional regulator of viral defense system
MEGLALTSSPDWNRLYEIAALQDGHFTTRQAAAAGFSPQLLVKHIAAGRLVRARHGIYRLVHYPAADNEDLTVIWLWSQQAGLFSHATALALHGLSDVLPAWVHLTLPAASATRRFRVPDGVVLHHADVPDLDRVWFGAVPATSAQRTLTDCARDHLSPDLLMQAARQALTRGLVVRADLAEVDRALRPYGGLIV